MSEYKKQFCMFFGFDSDDYIPCAVTGSLAVDIHHLDPRRMGGSKYKDGAWNLIPLSREAHDKAEADPEYNDQLKRLHFQSVVRRAAEGLGIKYKLSILE